MDTWALTPEVPAPNEDDVKAAHIEQCERLDIVPMPWDDLPRWVRNAWRRSIPPRDQ